MEQPKHRAETPLLDEVLERTSASLDSVAERYGHEIRSPGVGQLRRALLTAKGIEQLKSLLSPQLMKLILSLQGSPLGFLTDKDKEGGYPEPVVKDCVVTALLEGVMLTGNEFNIISGKCYVTQNGYKRKLKETAGFSDLVESPGVPTLHNGKVVVRYGAEWRLNGSKQQLRDAEGKPGRAFSVKINAGMGDDAVVGKARRKALKAVYEQIHGSEHSLLPDGEIGEEPGSVGEAPDTGPPVGRTNLRRTNGESVAPDPKEDLESKELFETISTHIGVCETAQDIAGAEKVVSDAEPKLGQKLTGVLREQLALRRGQVTDPE